MTENYRNIYNDMRESPYCNSINSWSNMINSFMHNDIYEHFLVSFRLSSHAIMTYIIVALRSDKERTIFFIVAEWLKSIIYVAVPRLNQGSVIRESGIRPWNLDPPLDGGSMSSEYILGPASRDRYRYPARDVYVYRCSLGVVLLLLLVSRMEGIYLTWIMNGSVVMNGSVNNEWQAPPWHY